MATTLPRLQEECIQRDLPITEQRKKKMLTKPVLEENLRRFCKAVVPEAHATLETMDHAKLSKQFNLRQIDWPAAAQPAETTNDTDAAARAILEARLSKEQELAQLQLYERYPNLPKTALFRDSSIVGICSMHGEMRLGELIFYVLFRYPHVAKYSDADQRVAAGVEWVREKTNYDWFRVEKNGASDINKFSFERKHVDKMTNCVSAAVHAAESSLISVLIRENDPKYQHFVVLFTDYAEFNTICNLNGSEFLPDDARYEPELMRQADKLQDHADRWTGAFVHVAPRDFTNYIHLAYAGHYSQAMRVHKMYHGRTKNQATESLQELLEMWVRQHSQHHGSKGQGSDQRASYCESIAGLACRTVYHNTGETDVIKAAHLAGSSVRASRPNLADCRPTTGRSSNYKAENAKLAENRNILRGQKRAATSALTDLTNPRRPLAPRQAHEQPD
jgi:hypothetical protein